jgi:phage regulator Rha-like protein
MNPDIQAIIDEIGNKFEEIKAQTVDKFQELDEKLDAKFTVYDNAWERKFANLEISHHARMCALECRRILR